MCLKLLDKPRIQQRARPVVCFKVLRPSYLQDVFITPFWSARYRTGTIKTAKRFSSTVWRGIRSTLRSTQKSFHEEIPKEASTVNRGLHGYQTVEAARRGAYCGGRIIVRCVIPPGTPFIRGKRGEIVALALTVGKAVYGKRSLQRQFNGE